MNDIKYPFTGFYVHDDCKEVAQFLSVNVLRLLFLMYIIILEERMKGICLVIYTLTVKLPNLRMKMFNSFLYCLSDKVVVCELSEIWVTNNDIFKQMSITIAITNLVLMIFVVVFPC